MIEVKILWFHPGVKRWYIREYEKVKFLVTALFIARKLKSKGTICFIQDEKKRAYKRKAVYNRSDLK